MDCFPSLALRRLRLAAALLALFALGADTVAAAHGATFKARLAAAKASSTTYYVDANGSDASSGLTASTAWRSIEKANVAARPGDTVVLSGTFAHQAIDPHQSGSPGRPITYRAAKPGLAVLKGPGPLYPATTLQGIAVVAGRSYIALDGLGFTYDDYVNHPLTYDGVRILASNHISITNSKFSHVPLVIQRSSDNDVEHNTFRDYVRSYVNPATGHPDPGHPLSSGDMVSITLGSSRNTIRFNDLRNAGHALIAVGAGIPGEPVNAANQIVDNTLSNPWYRDAVFSGDGGRTLIERNLIEDATTQPTLYSTACCPVDSLVVSSDAVQFSGSNFVLRNNTFRNNVALRGVITLGARWYSDSNIPNGEIVESMNNEISGNTITGNRALAGVSFVFFYGADDVAAARPQPRMTGNVVSGNVFDQNSPMNAPWGGSSFSDILYYAASYGTPWQPGTMNGNRIVGNNFQLPGARMPEAAGPFSYTAYVMTDGRSPSWAAYPLAAFQSTFAVDVQLNKQAGFG